MSAVGSRSSRKAVPLVIGAFSGLLAVGLGVALFAVLMVTIAGHGGGCSGASSDESADSIALGPPGSGARVGATEYGGPGDPASGSVGASGASLLAHPDSYAELGGETFQTATAMGGLPYMTPLRITWGRRSAIAYKRDFGLGGDPIAGLPRVIDLWWQFAGVLGIPYERGMWSGAIRVARPPVTGAGDVLAQAPTLGTGTGNILAQAPTLGTGTGNILAQAPSSVGAQSTATCSAEVDLGGLPLTPGPRAQLLSTGRAAAPQDAPADVKGIIAAGNQIVGKPYVYGGGHGLALDQIGPGYDCSSSVEHLLYGARLLPAGYDAASGALASFGRAGPGRWVTIYANADHVFMYVAGLRWDTHNAAGPQDGSSGIGWHPLVRSSTGFVARHPVGL